jgi:hypothetical protein
VRYPTAIVVLALAACAHPRLPPPAPLPPVSAGGVDVVLAWDAPVDLDLYVTDPAHETVYFAHPESRSGGIFARDARCAGGGRGPQVERVHWTAPPAGRYRVGVDFAEACEEGAPDVAPFQVLIDVDGRRQDVPGEARPRERLPLVVEFTVPGPERR